MNHVVMFSGGVGSWMAARRVAEEHGTENLHLLFTDTMIEDPDLYRFLDEAAANVGGTLHKIADGRDPFQVFKDVGFMGNSRVDPCSRVLKREIADKWMKDNFKPCNTVVYVGIDWSEEHRFTRLEKRKRPWIYKAPLCKPPYLTKDMMFKELSRHGIALPRLYTLGFPHNNCGGFCIKTGQAQFRKLFIELPERYLELEKRELDVYESLGSTKPFIRVTTDNVLRYLTMREFREQYLEKDSAQIDLFDWGGCGCFIDAEIDG